MAVLLGDGDGTFGAANFLQAGNSSASLVAADFDGDGKLDVAEAHAFSTVSVLDGDSQGGLG